MIPAGVMMKVGAPAALLLLGLLPAQRDSRLSPALQVIAQKGVACTTMEDALAAQALEGPVRRDTNPQSAMPGLCMWRSTAVPGDALTVREDAGGPDKYDFDRSRLPVHDLRGVGDKAFAFVSPAGFVQMGMMKSGIYVTLVLQLQHGQDRLERATQLAQAIAARM
jgi:hypothetical protein